MRAAKGADGQRARRGWRIVIAFVALLAASGLSQLAIVAPAEAAGSGQYSAPEWFPLREPARVGCALDNCSGPHHGYWAVDFLDPANQKGDPIYAAGAGRVYIISRNNDCRSDAGRSYPGNYMMVDHGAGRQSYYFHLDAFAVDDGAWVDQNTLLGWVGSTGNASPSCPVNHLHFEIKINGQRIDPVGLKACFGSVPVTYPEFLGSNTWNTVKGATVYSAGNDCRSLQQYAGKIVQREGDPTNTWYVTPDLRRLWIPNLTTYACLLNAGFPQLTQLPSTVIDAIPDDTGHWMPCGNGLSVNRALRRGMTVKSPDGLRKLTLQTDGNLVVYGSTGTMLWSNARSDTDYAVMQDDGNFATYRADRTLNWSTSTSGTNSKWLLLRNDGNLFVRSSTQMHWQSGTGGIDPGLFVNRVVLSPDPAAAGLSWLVSPDGKRLWVADQATRDCLRAAGVRERKPTAWTFDRLPDAVGRWAPCGDTVLPQRTLRRGMTITSTTGYRLTLQTDGNLVVYSPAGNALWANYRFDSDSATLLPDGNFATFRADGAINWSTNTAGSGANRLMMQPDGNLVLYAGTTAKWWTGTQGQS